MKPQTIHRFTIPLQAAIEQLFGQEATDGEAYLVTVEDDDLVVDIIEPASLRALPPSPPAEPPSHPVQPEAAPEKPKGGRLAQRAAIICGERAFWTFLAKRYGATVESADEAAYLLKSVCCVESRVEFDHNEAKAENFRNIDKVYRLWLDGFD